MRKLPSVLLAVLALMPSAFGAATESPTVTLPLEQFLAMRQSLEEPSATTIEEVRFLGDMRDPSTLAVRITGGTSGARKLQVDVLEQSAAFALHGCQGSAMLGFHDSRISVIPQKERFQLECRLDLKISAELEVAVLNALFVRSSVTGAELVVRSESAGRRDLTLARTGGLRPGAEGPVTASGRYRITVQPDDARFSYGLGFYNPNRTSRTFEIPLRNGEVVQDIRTTLDYEEKGAKISVTVTPGESQMVLLGKLGSASFSPPLASAQQFLIVENHPLLQLGVDTRARRISPGETGIAPQYSGALGYLLSSGEAVSWKAKKLAVFEAQTYTIERADYLYYLPGEGQGIVEAGFRIRNQGAPELALEVPGTAAYLEIDSVAQALYKDEAGRLLVHLPTGTHRLLVQYRPETKSGGLAGGVSQGLLRPEGVVSEASVRVVLDDEWRLLVGRAATEFRTLLEALAVAAAAALFFLYGGLFGAMGIPGRAGWLAALGPAAVALAVGGAFQAGLAIWAAALVLRRRKAIFKWVGASRWRLGGSAVAALACAYILAVFYGGSAPELETKSAGLGRGAKREESYEAKVAPAARAMLAQAPAAEEEFDGGALEDEALDEEPLGDGAAESAAPGGGFQGIPARITIPSGGIPYEFSQSLVERGAPLTVTAAFVSHRLLMLLAIAAAALTVVILARHRARALKYLALGG